MSQELTPISGGVVPTIQTTTLQTRANVLSPQYIAANHLESRPTEWVPGGRPIYRRLPATSETYQINFFNVVSESNVVPEKGIQEIGYVYVPYGDSINGATSIEVVASDNLKSLLVKSGIIVWKYGKTAVIPAILNLEVLEVLNGKYEIAYQLVYDDSPLPTLYTVEDFELVGQPLNITSSTDATIGWRYTPVNAFLSTQNLFWSSKDTYFPSYAQPSTSYIQWVNSPIYRDGECPDGSPRVVPLPAAYSKVTLRCPTGTAYTGSASLYYVVETEDPCTTPGNTVEMLVETVEILEDSEGQYFEFKINQPTFNTGWKVVFSTFDMAIELITVSGSIYQLQPQASPSPRAVLVMYPAGTLPKTVVNSVGETIPATYCLLAEVDVGSTFNLLDIVDTRYIIHRDYTPVADWLTKPFDSDLINLYEQVSDYANIWMAPPNCMKQEYAALENDQITVEV